jgi:hypothetical protein
VDSVPGRGPAIMTKVFGYFRQSVQENAGLITFS